MNPEEMKELEKNARELILAITEKTLKSLKDNGLLKEPSSLQKLNFSSPEIRAFLEKFKSPKYDPSRKFRKGDKVRVVEWNGRDIARVGQIGYVVSDEYNSRVELSIDGWTKDVYYPACHLELVTPVEELEPYIMLGNAPSNSIEVRNKRTNKVEATFYFGKDHAYTFEQASTRAEAERDRLNKAYHEEYEQALSHE